MIISSWNVNSVRARIENIKDYIKKSETLRRAMEGEITRLNKILGGLQRSDTA